MPKAATKQPSTAMTSDQQELENQIRLRAYELYEARGREDGHELEDWFRAKECGFEMTTASDPIEALGRCEKIGFDLALLDYQMPSLTGSQLALEIKFLVPDAPVVLLSGYAVLAPTELAFVDAHFGHGTHFDDLVDTMRRLTKSKPPGIRRTSATSWSDST
jgi:CheY-like chemotaxis protein